MSQRIRLPGDETPVGIVLKGSHQGRHPGGSVCDGQRESAGVVGVGGGPHPAVEVGDRHRVEPSRGGVAVEGGDRRGLAVAMATVVCHLPRELHDLAAVGNGNGGVAVHGAVALHPGSVDTVLGFRPAVGGRHPFHQPVGPEPCPRLRLGVLKPVDVAADGVVGDEPAVADRQRGGGVEGLMVVERDPFRVPEVAAGHISGHVAGVTLPVVVQGLPRDETVTVLVVQEGHLRVHPVAVSQILVESERLFSRMVVNRIVVGVPGD